MKLLKPNPDYEKKIVDWYGEEPEQFFVDSINRVAATYEDWGRADKLRGKPVADRGRFQAMGKLVFPDDEDADIATANAEYMKMCYMDGYREGRAT